MPDARKPEVSEQGLWLLRPRDEDDSRWGYDCSFGYVVAASSDEEARKTIVDRKWWEFGPGDEGDQAWLDPNHSTCEHIGSTRKYEGPTVVLRDFHAG